MQILEAQEMEILKRIRTTTQVHKNSKNSLIQLNLLLISLVCEQLENLNVQDFVLNNFENNTNESMNMNKSQSLKSLKKNNSFIKK